MRSMSAVAGIACGVVLAVAGGFAVDGALDDAEAQSGFSVTPAQLQTNQRISQAAVRRSNRALNYLAPIRTAASDAADNGRDGVDPLASVPGAGAGWGSGQIADGAITPAKVSPAIESRLQTVYRAAVFNTPGQDPALESQSEGVSALARTPALPAGAFDITFAQSIEGCTWTGSVSTVRGSAVTPVFAPFVVWPTRLGENQLRVFTFNASGAGTLADAPFVVTVHCG